MNVELAEERIHILGDRFSMDEAQGRAWAKRLDAFGALAKVGGFLSRPRDEDFTLAYRERRLQPFWRVQSSSVYAYERTREYSVPVAPEVRSVQAAGEERAIVDSAFRISGLERCREENGAEALIDGLSGETRPELAAYLRFDARDATPGDLANVTGEGTVVVPPGVKASSIVRDAVTAMLRKIDADAVLEETVRVEAVELYYRPVYAFRYAWQGKEAVMEFDGLTGALKPGGDTFEQYVGKVLEPRFLMEVGAETASLFFPGANLAKLVVLKGLELKAR